MTREERALRNLKQMCSDGRYLGSGSYVPLEVLEDFEVAIKALEQKSRWIPVSERLPEQEICKRGKTWEKEVLVTAYLPFDSSKDRYYVRTQFASRVINGGDENEQYIAWMPLPTLYKPHESEDKL